MDAHAQAPSPRSLDRMILSLPFSRAGHTWLTDAKKQCARPQSPAKSQLANGGDVASSAFKPAQERVEPTVRT
jgi:hypothetical protein